MLKVREAKVSNSMQQKGVKYDPESHEIQAVSIDLSSLEDLELDLKKIDMPTSGLYCFIYQSEVVAVVVKNPTMLSINIGDKINCLKILGTIEEGYCEIRAKRNLELDVSINSTVVEINVGGELEVNKPIAARQQVNLRAKEITNHNRIVGQTNTVDAERSIINKGCFAATQELVIKTPCFDDQGQCRSEGQMIVSADQWVTSKNSETKVKKFLHLQGKNYLHQGSAYLSGAAQYDVIDFTNAGELSLPYQAVVNTVNLDLLPGSKLGWLDTTDQNCDESQKTTLPTSDKQNRLIRNINVRNHVSIHEDALLSLKKANLLVANSEEECVSGLEVAGQLIATDTELRLKDEATVLRNGQLSITDSKLILTEPEMPQENTSDEDSDDEIFSEYLLRIDGELISTNSLIYVDDAIISGSVSIKGSNGSLLEFKNNDKDESISPPVCLKSEKSPEQTVNSVFSVNRELTVEKKGSYTAIGTITDTCSVRLKKYSQFSVYDSTLATDVFESKPKASFASELSFCKFENAVLCGETTYQKGLLQIGEVFQSGSFLSSGSTINIIDGFSSKEDSKLRALDSYFQAQYLSLNGDYELEKSSVVIGERLELQGKGKISESKAITKFFDTRGDEKKSIISSVILTGLPD